MHDHDFAIIEKTPQPGGAIDYRVRINALSIERVYTFDPASATYALHDPRGAGRILVGGHDMTSITGKRVREFLESQRP